MWEKLLEPLLKASWRIWFGLFVVSVALLAFPGTTNTQSFTSTHHVELVITALLSGSILFTFVATKGSHVASKRWHAARLRKRAQDHLHNLMPGEKKLCKAFLDGKGDPITHNIGNGEVLSLLRNKILLPPGPKWSTGMQSFVIQPWALKYLKEHPDLLD